MRITAIESYTLKAKLDRPFGWAQGWNTHRTVEVVKVLTDEGIVGWGEGGAVPIKSVVRDVLTPILLGQDPMNRVGLSQRMFGRLYNENAAVGIAGNAISAVDIALWDIAGKATGLSVSELLGGRVRNKVAVYATGLYYTEGDFPDRLVAEAAGYAEAGFKGVKAKIGGLTIAEDVKRVTAVRKAIGPDIHLAIDANQAYNAASAIRIGERLAGLDILWFEEPVGARDVEGYLRVKSALPMAVAGGENVRTRHEFKDFFAVRAYDIAQPDVTHVGGITEMRDVCAAANAFGVQVNPHVWGTPIMIAASLHLSATLPPCPLARNPQPYVQEPVMEFDRSPNPLREELCGEPFDQVDGFVDVPNGPGLGIEVDETALKRLTASN